jgi:hypothetical protein
MPPHLVHVRCRQVFPAFCDAFHVRTSPVLLWGHSPPKGWLKGTRAVQDRSSQTASLLVRRHRGGPQNPPVRDRLGGHPAVNQSLTSASQRSIGQLLLERRTPREGPGSVTISSDQVARPAARDGKPILQTSKTLNSETHANRILLQILAQSRFYTAGPNEVTGMDWRKTRC